MRDKKEEWCNYCVDWHVNPRHVEWCTWKMLAKIAKRLETNDE